MEITQINNETKGFFKAVKNNIEVGKMTYTWAGPDKLIIDHTEVNPEFRGQRVGKQMLIKIVKFSRENHIKIIPLCPYAKRVFEKTEEIRDVLA